MNGMPPTWRPAIVEIGGKQFTVESHTTERMVCVRVLIDNRWIEGATSLGTGPLEEQINQLARKIVAWESEAI